MHAQCPGVTRPVMPPHLRHNVFPGECAARVGGQEREEIEFLPGQSYLSSPDDGLAKVQIQVQGADVPDRILWDCRPLARGAPHHCLHPGQQFM